MNARAPVGACLLIFAGFAGAGSSGDFSRRISASEGPHVVANGATTAFSGQVGGRALCIHVGKRWISCSIRSVLGGAGTAGLGGIGLFAHFLRRRGAVWGWTRRGLALG